MRSRGFTLVEVLVAFTILALVMGATFTTIGNGLAQERRASETSYRVMAARSILDALGAGTDLRGGDLTGTLETGETWEVTLQAVITDGLGAEEAAAPSLYLADLTIYEGDRPVLNLVTLKRAEQ